MGATWGHYETAHHPFNLPALLRRLRALLRAALQRLRASPDPGDALEQLFNALWEMNLQPGHVVMAQPLQSPATHYVRLRHRARGQESVWIAAPICDKRNGTSRAWRILPPNDVPGLAICPACIMHAAACRTCRTDLFAALPAWQARPDLSRSRPDGR